MTENIDRPKKILKLFGREQSYWTAFASLMVYNFGIIFVSGGFLRSVFPIEQRSFYYTIQSVIVCFMILSCIGLILHAKDSCVRYTRWSYLLSFAAANLTLIVFLSGSSSVSLAGTLGISCLILVGAIVSFSMHMEHGGRSYTRKVMT